MTYRELMEKIIDMSPSERELEVFAFNNNQTNIKVYDLIKSKTDYYLEIDDVDNGKDEINRLRNIIDIALDELDRV